MIIRTANPSDKIYIKEILFSTNSFTQEEVNIAMEVVDDYFNNKASTYRIYVAADKNNYFMPDAFITFGKAPLSYSTYEIYWIAVRKSAQGKGIGSKLLIYAENEIAKSKGEFILIETSSKLSYQKTRKFYESLGYKQIAIIENFYAPGDSKIIYSKKLGDYSKFKAAGSIAVK